MKRKLIRSPLILSALVFILSACLSSPEIATEEEPIREPTAVLDVGIDAVQLVTAEFDLVQNEPVLALGEDGEWDSFVMRFPWVVRYDGMFHMFYEAHAGRNENGKQDLAIGYASSVDGISWIKSDQNPIFEADGTGFDIDFVARPVVHVEDDGTWVMYYATGHDEEGIGVVARATAQSPTGPWERTDDALLKNGPDDAWDDEMVLADQIIRVEGGYRMYFSGREQSGRAAMIGLATSADGVTWEKLNDPTNDSVGPFLAESDPILVAGPGWDARATWTPNVFPHRNGWMMLYNAFGSLGVAFSDDGIVWNKYEDNPIYVNSQIFHPFVILNDDGTYWIYFRSLRDESIYLMEGTIVID